MALRMNYVKAAPEIFQAMMAVENVVKAGGIEPALLHMVKLRASQINQCAYCIDMHWKDARAAGESETRLCALTSWREWSIFNDRERAALEWTESLTLLTETHAPDEVFQRVRGQFDDKQLSTLTWAIAAINAWNRMGVGFRTVPGKYTPAAH